ncbi:MAG: cyclic nucleotide-binding domain-containing protein [Myxococcales bacterium]|nr:cyclic nucleotide-binding domain-containing protein [Myxococcales bacterium]
MPVHPDVLRTALRRVPLFSKLDDRSLDAIGAVMRPRRYEENAVVFREGESGDSLVLVVAGRLNVCVVADGVPTDVASVLAGEIVGEMACIDPGPRAATVVASDATLVLELDRVMLQSLVQHAPEVGSVLLGSILRLISRRVRDTTARIDAELVRRRVVVPEITIPPPGDSGSIPGRIDLRAVACLKGFTNDELRSLVEVAPPRRIPASTVLCREGEHGDACFIIAAGEVEVRRRVLDSERTVALLTAGTLVGQLALVEPTPRSATLKLRTDGVILRLERSAFHQLLSATNPFAVKFQEQVAVAGVRQLRNVNRQFTALFGRPVSEAHAGRPVRAHGQPLPPESVFDGARVPRRPNAPMPAPTAGSDVAPEVRDRFREAAPRVFSTTAPFDVPENRAKPPPAEAPMGRPNSALFSVTGATRPPPPSVHATSSPRDPFPPSVNATTGNPARPAMRPPPGGQTGFDPGPLAYLPPRPAGAVTGPVASPAGAGRAPTGPVHPTAPRPVATAPRASSAPYVPPRSLNAPTSPPSVPAGATAASDDQAMDDIMNYLKDAVGDWSAAAENARVVAPPNPGGPKRRD